MRSKHIIQIFLLFLIFTGCSNSGNTNRETEQVSEPAPAEVVELDPLALHRAAINNDVATVQMLLVQGANVNAKDENERTALMYAAFEAYFDVMEALLSSGADPDLRDVNGRTALMFAASGPFPEAVSLLLEKGATTNIQDTEEHFTALMYAAAEGQLENIKLLIEYGADPLLKDVDGEDALVFAQNNNHEDVVVFLEELR